MNVKKHAIDDISTNGGGESPPCTGFIPDALPEVQKPVLAEKLNRGVSTQKEQFLKCRKKCPIGMFCG